MFDIVMKF